MESLATTLVVPDMRTKIAALKQYIKSSDKHGVYAKSYLPIVKEKKLLPLVYSKYSGKVAYINWITRGKAMYLNLNVCYDCLGNIRSFEVMTRGLIIKKLFDVNRVRTIDGKMFKKSTELKRKVSLVYSVDTKKLYSNKPIRLLENGLENFASRDKILQKFGVQLTPIGVYY